MAQVDPPKQQVPPEGDGAGEGEGEGEGVGVGEVDDITAHLPVKGTPLTRMFVIENLQLDP